MIYTTYFAKLKSLPDNIVPVSICGKAPDWYTGLQYKKLAPKYDFFMKWKQDHDNDYYIKCFNEQVLRPLDVYAVASELQAMVGEDKEVAMVCYEKPSDFCHRHLVSEWFRANHIASEEYVYGGTVK